MNRPERLFAVSSALYLVAWLASSLRAEVAGGDPTFLVGALGFAGMLIFGFSYHMLPRFWERRYDGVRPKYFHLLLANAGLLGVFVTDSTVFPVLWLLGVAVYLYVVSRSRRGEEIRIKPVALGGRMDYVSAGFLVAALTYLAAGSLLLLAEESTRVLHLFLLGFVLNTIFAFAYRMVTMFLGGEPSLAAASGQLVGSALGPGLVALGIGDGSMLMAGAVLESAAALLFVYNLSRIYRTGSRQKKPHRFLLLSLAFLLLGVGLGASFAFVPGTRSALREAHGWTNLFGFVAMFVFGVSYQTLIGYWKRGNVVVRNRGNIHLALNLAGIVPLIAVKSGLLPDALAPLFLSLLLVGAVIWAAGIMSVVWTMEKKEAEKRGEGA